MERKEECASSKYGKFFEVNERGEILTYNFGVCRRYPPQPSAANLLDSPEICTPVAPCENASSGKSDKSLN